MHSKRGLRRHWIAAPARRERRQSGQDGRATGIGRGMVQMRGGERQEALGGGAAVALVRAGMRACGRAPCCEPALACS
eukprot:6207673-Pleurochrysis_carterae.AAC.1